MEVYR